MKKPWLSLDKTWEKCLEMWQWIAEVKLGNPKSDYVSQLKETWIHENFGRKFVESNCFFCEYSGQHQKPETEGCDDCPGSLVNKMFNCTNESYDYHEKPIKFYNKLLELNEKRLSRRKH